jgi:hypothetical protein
MLDARCPTLQDGKRVDMTAYQRALAIYQEWERDNREAGARELLVHQLSHRFGDLPEHVTALIQRADQATLRRWATQVLTARTLDDVIS